MQLEIRQIGSLRPRRRLRKDFKKDLYDKKYDQPSKEKYEKNIFYSFNIKVKTFELKNQKAKYNHFLSKLC